MYSENINKNISVDANIIESILGSKDPIQMCQQLITDFFNVPSFEEFCKQKRDKRHNLCTEKWNEECIVGVCLDCQKSNLACQCIRCFVESNHEGHSSYFTESEIGNCDCGNYLLWDKKGCCGRHSRVKKIRYSNENEGKLYASIGYSLFYLAAENLDLDIFNWVLKFLKISRSICYAGGFGISNYEKFNDFLEKYIVLENIQIPTVVSQIFIHIQQFPKLFMNISKEIVNYYVTYMKKITFNVNDIKKIRLINQNFKNFYYVFCIDLIYYIENNQINWINVFIESYKLLMETLIHDRYSNIKSILLSSNIKTNMYTLIESAVKASNFKDYLREFSNSFVDFLIKYDQKKMFNRKTDEKENDFTSMCCCIFNLSISFLELIDLMEFDDEEPFNSLMKYISELKLNGTSVLDETTDLVLMYGLHIYALKCLRFKYKRLGKYLRKTLNKNNITPEKISEIPLKWLAVTYLSRFGLFVRNSEDFIKSASSMFFRKSLKIAFAPTFSLIQIMLGVAEDKNRFLIFIAETFGLFKRNENDNNPETECNIKFLIIYIIACLIFDRYCISCDYIGIQRMLIMTSMKIEGCVTLKDIINLLWYPSYYQKEFHEDLSNYSTLIHSNHSSFFKLTDDHEWNIILPFIRPNIVIEAINKLTLQTPKTLLPFPSFTRPLYGIDLLSVLNSKFLFALIYLIIYEYVNKVPGNSMSALHIALNLLINISLCFNNNNNSNEDTVLEVSSFEELIDNVPNDFDIFAHKHISYNSSKPESLIDLLIQLDEIGLATLRRMKISYELPKEIAIKEKEILNQKSSDAKKKILSQFKTQQSMFLQQFDEPSETQECDICHLEEADEIFVYPVYVYKTVLPLFIEKQINNHNINISRHIYGFRICNHCFHNKCFQINDNFVKCPLDRCIRNCSFPMLPSDLHANLSEKSKTALYQFMKNAFGDDYMNDVEIILYSYIGEIISIETLYRISPDQLDRTTNYLILKNIFNGIYRVFSTYDFSCINTSDHFLKFIINVIQSKNIKKRLNRIVQRICKTIDNELQLYTFLRRVAIFQHFGLDIPIEESSFIDWDNHLMFSSLCSHYGIEEKEEIELPIFHFIDLPKDFFGFTKKPFLYDISRKSSTFGICLLTGKIIAINPLTQESLKKFINERMKCGFCLILLLTGQEASIPIIGSCLPDIVKLRGFYVNVFKDDDPGLKNGFILKFSQEKMNDLLRTVITGDWIDNII